VSYAVPASSKSQICRRFRVSKGQLAPITRWSSLWARSAIL